MHGLRRNRELRVGEAPVVAPPKLGGTRVSDWACQDRPIVSCHSASPEELVDLAPLVAPVGRQDGVIPIAGRSSVEPRRSRHEKLSNLLYGSCYRWIVARRVRRKQRLAATEARSELSAILREFAAIEEPGDSIADRAVRIGLYKEDSAVLIPLADFERALETEELLEDLLIEMVVAERLAKGPGRTYTIEEVARELGLAAELGLE